MAILHGREPEPLRQVALWDGSITYVCPACGTSGSADHVIDGDQCRLLRAERETKNRE